MSASLSASSLRGAVTFFCLTTTIQAIAVAVFVPSQASAVTPPSSGSPEKYSEPNGDVPQCTNPTEPVNGVCPAGSVAANTIASIPETRCVPMIQCPNGESVTVNCSANDSDVCKPCATTCSPCAMYTMRYESATDFYQGFDLSYDQAFPPLPANAPQCLRDIKADSVAWYNMGTNRYKDDTLLSHVLNALGVLPIFSRSIGSVGEVPEISCSKVCTLNDDYCSHYYRHCVSGTFAFNQDCQFVDIRSLQNTTCSLSNISTKIRYQASSPISLVLRDGGDIEDVASFVQFPLNLTGADKWYVWRASAETPLVVYDPDSTGMVNSPTQLFGNWAFGGKRTASLHGSMSDAAAPAAPAPWANGYDALATLDQNGDAVISGAELAPLAIWYDRNQDAVSQPGEMVRAADAGITKLFVGPARENKQNRNVHVAVGYARILNGREVTGETVDWYSEGASSQTELLSRQTLRGVAQDFKNAAEAGSQRQTGAIPPALKDAVSGHGKLKENSALSGIWEWRPETASRDVTAAVERGTLLIEEFEDGTITAISLAEAPVKDPSRKVGAYVNFKIFGGKVGLNTESAAEVRIHSLDGDGGVSSANTVALLKAGSNVLSGTTEERLLVGTKTVGVTYHWTARRLQ